jgi:hypothetical protein
VQFEMAQILLDDGRHRHAQGCREILYSHGLLLLGIGEVFGQAAGQILGASRLVKVDGDIFSDCHLAKIGQIGTDNGHSVGARQMRHAAATGGGGVRHDGYGRSLEKIGQAIFIEVAGKFDSGIGCPLFLDRLDIAGGLGVVSSRDDEPGLRQGLGKNVESLNHELEALVGSPFTEGKDSMCGIAAAGEIGIFGTRGEDAVGTEMHVVASIFFVEDLAVSGHEHGDGIRTQKHFCREGTGQTVSARMLDAGIFEVDGVHQVMQRDMRVATRQTSEKRGKQARERDQRIPAEGAKEQVEPNDIGLELIDRTENSNRAGRVVERPAAEDGKALEFGLRRGSLVGKDGEAEKWIGAKLTRNMEPILAQSTLTRWKGGDQTDFHSISRLIA